MSLGYQTMDHLTGPAKYAPTAETGRDGYEDFIGTGHRSAWRFIADRERRAKEYLLECSRRCDGERFV